MFANEARAERHLSQAEITRAAQENAQQAKQKMRQLLSSYTRVLREGEDAALMRAQAAFEQYADLQSRLVAAPFETGSIYPTVVLCELRSLYEERAKELERLLEQRRNM